MIEMIWAVLAIILIDVVLAGDNALVIGMAANKLPEHLKKKAIIWGTFGAVAVRFAAVAALTYLLMVPGLRLMGGLLLVYIAWQLAFHEQDHNVQAKDTFWSAIGTIVVADARSATTTTGKLSGSIMFDHDVSVLSSWDNEDIRTLKRMLNY